MINNRINREDGNNKNLSNKVLNSILNVLVFLLTIFLIVSIFSLIQTKVLKAKYSNFFGYSLFEVKTGSMDPNIKAGDFIIVHITKNVKINDVISYVHNEEIITHKVVEKYNQTYVTKGVANNSKDLPISEEQIIGKVVKILPYFGIAKNTVFNPFVLISLIVTVYLFLIVFKREKKPTKKVATLLSDLDNKEKLTQLKSKPVKEIKKEEKEVLEKTEDIKGDKVNEEETTDNENVSIKISEEFHEEITSEEISSIEEINEEDDLEKTQFFRMISVDSKELENTLVNITEEEIKKPVTEVAPKKEIQKTEELEKLTEEEKTLREKAQMKLKVKNDLELLVGLKNEEIINIFDEFSSAEKTTVKNSKYKKIFAEVYSKGLYYNSFDSLDINYTGKNHTLKMNKIKTLFYKSLPQAEKEQEVINIYKNYFEALILLDNAYITINDEKRKKEYFLTVLEKQFEVDVLNKKVDKIISIKNKYNDILSSHFNKATSPTFELSLKELKVRKNKYLTSLAHNIAFSKVFSDYIIDKTYTEGIIAEDKLEITLTLILKLLAKNVLKSDFNNEYFVSVPVSLFSKDKKMKRILNIFNNELALKSIVIAVDFDTLNKYEKQIKTYTQEGYQFALMLEDTEKIFKKDRKNIYLNKYIFVNNKTRKLVMPHINEDYKGFIINESIKSDLKEN